MKKIRFIHVAALAVTLTGPALAADLPMKSEAPYVEPRFSWTGCYVGGHVGGGKGSKAMTDPVQLVQDSLIAPGTTAGVTTVTTSPTGAVIGGEIGCDYQFSSNVVVGIEGTASGTTMKGSAMVGLPAGVPGDVALVQANNDFLAGVTGRVGYAFDTVLVYARGGFAVAGDKYDVSGGTFAGGGPFHFQGVDNRYGWIAGGGVDWAFARHWSANVEYDYYGFGNGNILMTDQFSGTTGVVNVKQSVQVIKVGLNFHIWGSGW
ncbi:outer membrane protein [Bradyrhizobium sp.]|jgi:outer membrane immunogenic protein|uniref:outer membrane protein n=1 Tax=Bradyrhizobium sp. TaxID=376 RepID=UPI003C206292